MLRIKFILLFLTIFVLFLFTSAMSQDAKTRFKIDGHDHYRGDQQWVDETVKVYRQYNTMVTVFTPFTDIDKMKDLMKKYPDVFIGWGSISLDDPLALDKIDAFYLAGFKGIGELSKPLKNFDDPKYFPIYERIQMYGIPVHFHVGIVQRRSPDIPEYSAMARMRPAYIEIVARAFPKLKVFGSHLGNPWYEEAAETLRWNPNLFYDITGSSLIKKDSKPEYWGDVLWWRPSLETRHSPSAGEHAFEKVFFGTDEGPEGLLPNIERFEKLLRANNVPESVQEKCWSGTLVQIMGIKPKK